MDVDGTLTDGKIYMGPDGEAMKAFSIKDGYVINFILKPAEITPVILTARTSSIVRHRCEELGIDEIYQGRSDKLTALYEIIGKDGLGNCAYFGDDILDLKCMTPIKEAGGIAACPADAVAEVKAIADYVCISKAGEGALREFSEWLVRPRADEEEICRRVENSLKYLKGLNISESDVGTKRVVNDNFFYSVQSYMTKPAEECRFESHRRYVDIQILAAGEEIMDLADISRLSVEEEYSEQKDVMYWNTPRRMSRVSLGAGDSIVLYPETAHRGGISVNESKNVLKVVGKVSVCKSKRIYRVQRT